MLQNKNYILPILTAYTALLLLSGNAEAAEKKRAIFLEGLTLKAAKKLCKIYPCFVSGETNFEYKKIKVKISGNKYREIWLRRDGKNSPYKFRYSNDTEQWMTLKGKITKTKFTHKSTTYKIVSSQYLTVRRRGRYARSLKKSAYSIKRACLRHKRCRKALNRSIRKNRKEYANTRYIPTGYKSKHALHHRTK